MDPGRKIYLSNIKKNWGQKLLFEQQNQNNFPEREIFFFRKKFGKNKIWEKKIEIFISTSSNYT